MENTIEIGEREYIDLCDLLKLGQIAQTGGHAKILIQEGLVKVDGQVETRKRCKIRKGQKVECESNMLIVV